jgi:membrane-bound serine protease (ClpP class)
MSIWFVTIGLIIFGFLLLLVEIFLIPGFNVFGVLGFIAIIGGIISGYSSLPQWQAHLVLFGSLLFSIILVRLLIRSKTWKKIVLDTVVSEAGSVTVQNAELANLVNREGIAYSLLRPAGLVLIDGQKYDVVSEGSFVEKNARITVLKVEGTRIIVRQIN